ncbi:alanine racemase [Nocardioides donggukensis]|uniref:Alanine racemase n=1 Tax=Nocardioides donggukensis TaxID=2774019 RepID=A0A927Q0T6_9ACTN|nr:alanine racemase [Nocardioides donggukensis]MBD8871020.1 alanine racemase [Nocardioides donggukensis]
MSLTLYVDRARFRANQQRVLERRPGLVPVAKGNGYGVSVETLAAEAAALGVDVLAVGTYDELPAAESAFPGSLLVLTPWRPFGAADRASSDPRVIHTVSRPDDLARLLDTEPGARFVLEHVTSMLRHGMTATQLRELAEARSGSGDDGRLEGLEGVAFHLPMTGGSHLAEVRRLLTDVVAAGLPTRTVFVSHLTDDELAALARDWPDFTIRPRTGTDLWLGDREALRARATVLDVHPVDRGAVYGYRGRSAPRAGTILVVSGGTAHGIGLEAPTGAGTVRARAAALARGGLDAVGLVRSPYSIGGKPRLFAEPPHMQASMLFLPAGAPVPEIGDEVDVRVRFTATSFDRVQFS